MSFYSWLNNNKQNSITTNNLAIQNNKTIDIYIRGWRTVFTLRYHILELQDLENTWEVWEISLEKVCLFLKIFSEGVVLIQKTLFYSGFLKVGFIVLCSADVVTLRSYFKQYSRSSQMFLKQVKRNFSNTVPRYFLLALGGTESYENDNSDFEKALHFEVAIVED